MSRHFEAIRTDILDTVRLVERRLSMAEEATVAKAAALAQLVAADARLVALRDELAAAAGLPAPEHEDPTDKMRRLRVGL